jgi:hypothetical protein
MNSQEMAMGTSSVQFRIWGVGIATAMLVAAAGASMAPAKLGQAGSPAAANGAMMRGDAQAAQPAANRVPAATQPALFDEALLKNAPPAAGATR